MKSGYYIYDNEKYRFELDGEYMTVVNEKGIDLKKFADALNGKYKEKPKIQILKVKLFPNWNDAIIFHNYNLDSIGVVSTFKILGIIEFTNQEKEINALQIHAKELEYMYNSSKIIRSFKYDTKGNMDMRIKSYEEVNSEEKHVKLKDSIIYYSFEIERKISTKNVNRYFMANTMLSLRSDSFADNYESVYEMILICQAFISYLYYRQNINLSNIDVLSRDKNNKCFSIGKMIIYRNNGAKPDEEYVSKHYINYEFIKTIDDKILQAIIDEKLFIRHIPENEIKRNEITPQSFVIVSSAFEWEFRQLFPDGVKHKTSKTDAIEVIKHDLLQLSSNYDKTKRKIMEKTIENIGKDNLESKLIFTNKELKEVSEIFLKYLCKLNDIKSENEIFTNLQKLRNDFAHGNMEIDIDSDGFVGIIYLERLIYIMQLKRFGLDDNNIKKAVNNLFGGNLAL